MYVVIGPDGQDAAPIDLPTLRAWASAGQLPPSAPVRQPSGSIVNASQMPDLKDLYAPTSSLPSFIPAGNPDSLWSYYTGLFSLFPICGLPLGIFAVFKGVRALKAVKENPEIRGRTHALVGLICGGLGILINGPLSMLLIWGLTHAK